MAPGKERGSLTLLAVFIFFLFSSLGLGLVFLSQLHLKTGAYRKSTVLLAYAAENGIKQEFALIAEKAAAAAAPAECPDARFVQLSSDIAAGRVGIVGEVLGGEIPFLVEGASGDQTWTGWTEFAPAKITAQGAFFPGRLSGDGPIPGPSPRIRPRKIGFARYFDSNPGRTHPAGLFSGPSLGRSSPGRGGRPY